MKLLSANKAGEKWGIPSIPEIFDSFTVPEDRVIRSVKGVTEKEGQQHLLFSKTNRPVAPMSAAGEGTLIRHLLRKCQLPSGEA